MLHVWEAHVSYMNHNYLWLRSGLGTTSNDWESLAFYCMFFKYCGRRKSTACRCIQKYKSHLDQNTKSKYWSQWIAKCVPQSHKPCRSVFQESLMGMRYDSQDGWGIEDFSALAPVNVAFLLWQAFLADDQSYFFFLDPQPGFISQVLLAVTCAHIVGHMGFVCMAYLCHCSMKAATWDIQTYGGAMSNKTSKNLAMVCQFLDESTESQRRVLQKPERQTRSQSGGTLGSQNRFSFT